MIFINLFKEIKHFMIKLIMIFFFLFSSISYAQTDIDQNTEYYKVDKELNLI
jgi:hypothetical protein